MKQRVPTIVALAVGLASGVLVWANVGASAQQVPAAPPATTRPVAAGQPERIAAACEQLYRICTLGANELRPAACAAWLKYAHIEPYHSCR